jgi:type II secretory pathway predicted ATPase ExeA
MIGRPTIAANPLKAKRLMHERRLSQSALLAKLLAGGVKTTASGLSRYINHGLVRGFDQARAAQIICKTLGHDAACEHERAHEFTQLPERAMLTSTAREKFRFTTDPFGINCVHEDSDVHQSTSFKAISNDLYYCAKNGDVMAVIGESGSGKSTLKKMFLQRVAKGNEGIVVIQSKVINREKLRDSHLCEAIVENFGEKPKRSLEALSAQILRLLSGSAQSAKKCKHVLLIDEGHDLTPQMFKYLKRFYEMEHGYTQLLSIVVFGQPELALLLDPRRWDMREVSQRFSQVTLEPLHDAKAIRTFLELKLRRIGADPDQLLEPRVEESVKDRLTLEGKNKARLNMCYPLAIQNLMTVAFNEAAKIGDTRITRDLILGV